MSPKGPMASCSSSAVGGDGADGVEASLPFPAVQQASCCDERTKASLPMSQEHSTSSGALLNEWARTHGSLYTRGCLRILSGIRAP